MSCTKMIGNNQYRRMSRRWFLQNAPLHPYSTMTGIRSTTSRSIAITSGARTPKMVPAHVLHLPAQIRQMSDNILGYNPMANHSSLDKNLSKSSSIIISKDESKNKPSVPFPAIGVDSNTEGGGIWAQTNAKRDKLGELRMELSRDLGQMTLDDAATSEEKLDNYLVDGIKSVACQSDGKELRGEIVASTAESLSADLEYVLGLLKDFEASLQQQEHQEKQQHSNHDEMMLQVNRMQYESHFQNLIRHVKEIKAARYSALKPSLIYIRDIMEFVPPNENNTDESTKIPLDLERDISVPIAKPFAEFSEYYRILLLEACLEYLSTKYDDLVKIADADRDRAAATGTVLNVPDSVNIVHVHRVLEAFGREGCSERVRHLWNLMDRDGDGLLNEVEMNEVVYMSIKPVEEAFRVFVKDCVDAGPLRCLPSWDSLESRQDDNIIQASQGQNTKGWYQKWKQQRVEKKAKDVILKLLNKAIKRHFEIDVEVAHRLRCCYAWAEKEHQEGKVTSILVDHHTGGGGNAEGENTAAGGDSGGGFFSGGRKRYVELDPKISYREFRDVQKGIFQHLDRVSEELCNGFKEELWIRQGTQRQNAVLKRECLAFLAVVSLLDIGITLS